MKKTGDFQLFFHIHYKQCRINEMNLGATRSGCIKPVTSNLNPLPVGATSGAPKILNQNLIILLRFFEL